MELNILRFRSELILPDPDPGRTPPLGHRQGMGSWEHSENTTKIMGLEKKQPRRGGGHMLYF